MIVSRRGAWSIFLASTARAPRYALSIVFSVALPGDCYFSIIFDVKQGAFEDLMVNGEA